MRGQLSERGSDHREAQWLGVPARLQRVCDVAWQRSVIAALLQKRELRSDGCVQQLGCSRRIHEDVCGMRGGCSRRAELFQYDMRIDTTDRERMHCTAPRYGIRVPRARSGQDFEAGFEGDAFIQL